MSHNSSHSSSTPLTRPERTTRTLPLVATKQQPLFPGPGVLIADNSRCHPRCTRNANGIINTQQQLEALGPSRCDGSFLLIAEEGAGHGNVHAALQSSWLAGNLGLVHVSICVSVCVLFRQCSKLELSAAREQCRQTGVRTRFVLYFLKCRQPPHPRKS